jgi:mono/diheme cytochrome c family protein
MRRFLLDALITILLLVLVLVFAGYLVARQGLSARAEPPWIEDVVAGQIVSMSIPAKAKSAVNPLANQADAWRTGGRHFEEECAVCHGDDGRGKSEIGRNMYPKAPDMTGDTQEMSDGELFYIIQNGVRYTGMPAWEEDHTPAEGWQLVSFIRHLPKLTPEEIQELKSAGGEQHGEHGHEPAEGEKPPAPAGERPGGGRAGGSPGKGPGAR